MSIREHTYGVIVCMSRMLNVKHHWMTVKLCSRFYWNKDGVSERVYWYLSMIHWHLAQTIFLSTAFCVKCGVLRSSSGISLSLSFWYRGLVSKQARERERVCCRSTPTKLTFKWLIPPRRPISLSAVEDACFSSRPCKMRASNFRQYNDNINSLKSHVENFSQILWRSRYSLIKYA
jgi:hypothetical protein